MHRKDPKCTEKHRNEQKRQERCVIMGSCSQVGTCRLSKMTRNDKKRQEMTRNDPRNSEWSQTAPKTTENDPPEKKLAWNRSYRLIRSSLPLLPPLLLLLTVHTGSFQDSERPGGFSLHTPQVFLDYTSQRLLYCTVCTYIYSTGYCTVLYDECTS